LYNGSLTNHGYGGLERKQKHLQGIIIDSTWIGFVGVKNYTFIIEIRCLLC
jgi:hypothetical protein